MKYYYTRVIYLVSLLLISVPSLAENTQKEVPVTTRAMELIGDGLCQIGLGTATFANRQLFHIFFEQMFNSYLKSQRGYAENVDKFKDWSALRLAFIISNYLCSEMLRTRIAQAIKNSKLHKTDTTDTHSGSDIKSKDTAASEASSKDESETSSYTPSLSFLASSALSLITLYQYKGLDSMAHMADND